MKILYTGIPKVIVFSLITVLILLISLASTTVLALPSLQSFDQDPGLIMSDQDLYSLPLAFSTPEKIQQFLVGNGSFLSAMNFVVSLEPDSAVLNQQAFANKPIQFRSPTQLGPFLGSTMSAANVIWYLSRSNMSSSCSIFENNNVVTTNNICYDSLANPINPGFLISLIQKESGLIYGVNSRLNPADAQTRFLLDRVVGYYCFENPDRSKSCYDENPDWKYYKGFFRQLYYATRLLRLREQMCRAGGSYAYSNSSGVFQVGSFVYIDGRQVQLKNGISCAMYIYTPHFSGQRLALQIMTQLQIDRNLIEVKGLPADYIPQRLYPFSDGEQPVDNIGNDNLDPQ